MGFHNVFKRFQCVIPVARTFDVRRYLAYGNPVFLHEAALLFNSIEKQHLRQFTRRRWQLCTCQNVPETVEQVFSKVRKSHPLNQHSPVIISLLQPRIDQFGDTPLWFLTPLRSLTKPFGVGFTYLSNEKRLRISFKSAGVRDSGCNVPSFSIAKHDTARDKSDNAPTMSGTFSSFEDKCFIAEALTSLTALQSVE